MNDTQYKERLIVEYRQLIERRALLEKTLNTDSCTNIDSKQLELMRKQFEGMCLYETCLQERIVDLMK